MQAFPKTRNFTGYFAPSRAEVDIEDLIVSRGEIPAELDGAFYRCGPDPQYPPRNTDDIWFNGDGMVSAFRFKAGKVNFRQRWVRTDKWRLEREARRALFGAYRNPLDDDPAVAGKIRGTANTNALVHAGVLLALKEDSPAVAMDPVTLETIGNWDFRGTFEGQTFTAHPKIDPLTGEMHAFGYAASGVLTNDVVYMRIDREGRIVDQTRFACPYYCMLHDFGVTERYVVFHVIPITGSWDRLRERKPHFGFDTSKEVYLGVFPRNGGAEKVRWFRGPNCFASHVMNAFDEGERLHIDLPTAPGNLWPFFPDIADGSFDPRKAKPRMMRWTVDMASDNETIQMTPLSDLVGEFPRIDERFSGRPYRQGCLLVQDDTKPFEAPGSESASGFIMNTLARLDLQTGQQDCWWVGPTSSLQEPAFIPRPGSTEEGDGWWVMVENRLAEMRSNLLLFEGRDLAAGPVAVIELPLRLRHALHGNWTPAAEIAGLEASGNDVTS